MAQEQLVPLNREKVIIPDLYFPQGRLKSVILDTLELPFFDDFSKVKGQPDVDLWTDVRVFINNTYCKDPVSIGVATFDAIDFSGNLNGDSDTPFESDFLTSMPINLDYPGRNDIYLSFFYQPQGLGDKPETWDSLIVEFYAPYSDTWTTVWAKEGTALSAFSQVFIQVADTSYLKKGFRFRFKNYASLPKSQSFPSYDSNVDHWNIDYVYLDKGRSPDINTITDVSMISELPSLFKTYQSIPWKHFSSAFVNEIRPFLNAVYRNNDNIIRNVTRKLEITDLNQGVHYQMDEGAVNVNPGKLDTVTFAPDYDYTFYNDDSVVFKITSYLVTDLEDYKWNDTVKRYQVFTNYYAYDDGSAEAGYGLSGEGTINAAVATQFKTYKRDTLRAVDMYFNRSLDNISQNYFFLSVWSHDAANNSPGDLIYSKSGYRPEYYNELNKFYTYSIDTILVVSETFYIGWIQTTTDLLNIGFDKNTNSKSKIFYNLGQKWVNTSYTGSLMMRPVLGKKLSWPSSLAYPKFPSFKIYPNPANDYIIIDLPDSAFPDHSSISIYSLQGSLLYHGKFENGSIDVSFLSPGMYIIRLNMDSSAGITSKLLITR